MQHTMTKARWGVLATLLAIFALAVSLIATQPAIADDDLTAGNADMTAQAEEATSWPFQVYVQHGDGEPALVKSYTKDEFVKMVKEKADPVSGLHWDGSSWYVTTAVSYVTLEDLLDDAGVQWGKGATLAYSNSISNQVPTKMTYDEIAELNFYPKTTRTVRSTESPVSTGLVFGTSNAKAVIIGDSATAEDVQTVASATSKNDEAILPVMGSKKTEYDTLTGTTVSLDRFVDGINTITVTYSADKATMYRLYNPNSGEHFYTSNAQEKKDVVDAGWNDEGTGWTAPVISNTPVYRVYNPNAGDHHYTTNKEERDWLVGLGWNDEGIGWYSDDAKAVPLFRLYNPNAIAGAHHYTTNEAERDNLVKEGWNDEGIGWYGLA